jgi:hypothetical protein
MASKRNATLEAMIEEYLAVPFLPLPTPPLAGFDV